MKREVNDMAEKKKYYSEEVNAKYKKENYVQFAFRVHKTFDADVLEFLRNCPNKQGYIIDLIRADIEKSKE